jgi:hypothetical protein
MNEVISDRSDTQFQALAWDPEVGTSDGDGINRVRFEIIGPSPSTNTRHTQSEYSAGYCTFGGNNPCNQMSQSLWDSLPNGTYTIRAQARANDGRYSVWDEVDFIIDKPPTPTSTETEIATDTPTPAPSRTPACGPENPNYPCLTPPW